MALLEQEGGKVRLDKPKLWTTTFILITVTNFFMFFAFQLFPSALPPYLQLLGASDSVLGWLQGILTIATLLVRPFAGIALDRYGPKGVFLIGLTGMILSTAAYMFFPVVGVILAIRFVHGMAWGIASTAGSTIASDNIEKTRFAEGMGYFSLASSIAMAVAPAVGLSIMLQSNVLLALLFLAMAFIIALIIKYQKQPVTQGVERRKMLLYAKESILPSVTMLFVSTAYGAVVTFLAVYSKQRSIEGIGLFFTVYAISMLVTRPVLGKIVDQKGFGAGVWPGVVLIPAALLLLSVSKTLMMFLICAVLFGVGIGAAQASLQTKAIVSASRERTGAANATFLTCFDAGIGIGSVLAGFLSSAVGYGNMFAFLAISPVLAGVLFIVTSNRNIKVLQ